MSFNLAIVDGRLGKDVEVRATTNGKKVVSFSIASDFGYGDNKGTQWDTIVAWGAQAEFSEKFLKKGSSVLVVGERRTRTYESNGEKKYIVEIHADSIKFTGSKSDSVDSGQKPAGRTQSAPASRTQAIPAARAVSSNDDDPFGDGTGITSSDVDF